MEKKTRQQLRNEKRKQDKIRNRVYTFDEMYTITNHNVRLAKREYDMTYALALATTLHAEPFKFGKVRVCRAVKALFGQLDAIENKVLDPEDLIKEASELGVKIRQEGESLQIYIDLGKTKDKGDYV